MSAVDLFFTYLSRSSAITLIVLGWLSLYFIISVAIVLWRSFYLSSMISKESDSLNAIVMGANNFSPKSILRKCSYGLNASFLKSCVRMLEKEVSIGLSWLSIIASTSPFIGLFGTVVSILETFGGLGSGGASASLGVIAPAISEALVATASGIFVAIPAYTFHSLIRRKGYEFMNVIRRQVDLMESKIYKQETKQQDIL